jgi:hypothetical protein
MSISRHNYGQLPLDGLDLPPARGTRGPVADLIIIDDPMPGTRILNLPRYDIAWEVKKGRNGWPKVNPKTRKVVKHRVVWDALMGNARNAHWSARAKAAKLVIADVVRIGTAAGLEPCKHVTIRLVWAPGDMRTADEDNLWNLQKVIADGLARGPRKDLPGMRLVPDDTSTWMTKLGPRIDRPPTPAGLWLELHAR